MKDLYLTRPRHVLLYGVLIWLITFAVSIVIFPLRTDNRPLFESIMPVTLTFLTVLFSTVYLNKVTEELFTESVVVGLLWYMINIFLDLLLFLPPSPMQMSFIDYMYDIGLTYLLIPIIPIGLGYFTQYKNTNN